MGNIFSNKKIKLPDIAPEVDEVKSPIKRLINDFDKLKKSITEEQEDSKVEYKKEINKPVYPLYCPNCGNGFFTKIDDCSKCGKEMDYSRYGEDYLGSSDIPQELFFHAGTNESFTYDLTNGLIKLYYLSTPESNYLEISNILFSIKSNMEAMKNPFGVTNSIEDILTDLDVTPDNRELTKNLSNEFSSNLVDLSKDLLEQLHDYLINNSKGNYNYLKINNYLVKSIFDESMFGEE